MKRLLMISLFLLPLLAGAKTRYNWMNSEEDWKRLKMEQTLTVSISEIDTAIIVVSNRRMEKNNLRFMCEESQKNHLYYFFVYAKGGIWHILTTPSLSEAMQYLPDENRDWGKTI